jgi:tRNA (cytidine/uridine-2'-O-)-methyltransferase
MFHVVLYEPEIPPNTGNIIRLCANTGCHLHLIEPLGFEVTDRQLKRAGLDYHDQAILTVHRDWAACRTHLSGRTWYAMTTKSEHWGNGFVFHPGDVFLFGPETRGLPDGVLSEIGLANALRIPMLKGSRSLNLSNAVAVTIFRAWEQNGFLGAV